MSILTIDYGFEDDFNDAIAKAKELMNKRVDDYKNIENRVRSVSSSSGNCENCADYTQKKYKQIQGDIEKLNTLKKKVGEFVDTVSERDKTVADRIKKDTDEFTKNTGIGKTSKSLWSSFCELVGDAVEWVGDVASNVVSSVKSFYEKNKYLINIVVDVVAVVAGVAAIVAGGGALAIAVAAFGLLNSISELGYDAAAAYCYYVEGDEVEAERLADKGGKDAAMWIGRKIDEKVGTDFWEGAFGVLHSGLSICAIGVSFWKTGSRMLKDFKLDKIKVKSLFNNDRKRIKWETHFNKDNAIKATRNFLGFGKIQQKDISKTMWKKVLGVKVGQIFIKTPERAKTYLQVKQGYDFVKDFAEYNTDYWNNVSEGKINPFMKTGKAVKGFTESLKLASSGGA